MSYDRKAVTFAELLERDALTIGDGYRAKNLELVGDGPLFLRSGRVSDGRIDFGGDERFDVARVKALEPKMGQPGDTVVTTKGNSIGVTAFVPEDAPQFVYSPHLSFWRSIDSRVVVPAYLRYWARSSEFRNQLRALAGSTDMAPYLNLADQRRLQITLPSAEDQRRIAGVLGALDDKIEAEAAIRRNLDRTVRIAGLHLIHQGSASWALEPLSAHFEATRGLSYTGAGLRQEPAIPLHNLNSVREGGGYKFKGIKYYAGAFRERHTVVPGDLVVANTEQGFDELLIGYPAIIPDMFGEPGIFSHHLHRVRTRKGSPVSQYWLYVWLLDRANHDLVTGYANGTTVNMLPLAALADPAIGVPPVERARQLDAVVVPLLARIESSVAQASRLITLRDALIPKLVSGQIRVPDSYNPDDALGTVSEGASPALP